MLHRCIPDLHGEGAERLQLAILYPQSGIRLTKLGDLICMNSISDIAEAYVKLVLAVGQHEPGYVDAYIGPAAWQAEARHIPLTQLLSQADELNAACQALPPAADQQQDRQRFLQAQVASVLAYIGQLNGKRLSFNEESRALYDAVSPPLSWQQLDQTLTQLDQLVPGSGELNARLAAYHKAFEIPRGRLDQVFSAAIAEARQRTRQYIALPDNEHFDVGYVNHQVWSAYNWYKGQAYSLIEVNTDFPMFISRAIDLAAHEGYPGHHVFNLLIEQDLVQRNGWVEYAVYPLYSPASFLAEGSANYGIEVAFPWPQRMAFEQQVLFPLAGIDAGLAPDYYRIQDVLQSLSYAGNLVAQHYLDGEIGQAEAIGLLNKYSLSDPQRSAQRLKFIEQHRSYVINYNLGQDVVKAYVEQRAGDDHAKRWAVLSDLLRRPKTASMMQAEMAA